ncbi:hypothetical protein [Empedobacter brevis]|uniref:hypothetical protein n=1 Tax=Empedobacter brevis TaxID=247 RepID=UPI0028A0AEBB|nr:hypothetical protein [Empedobacter brevis]
MKNLYFLLLFILFVQCEQPSNQSAKSWENTDEIKADSVFKDKNVNEAIEQAIYISKNNQIVIRTISLVFTKEKFYLYISSAGEDCSIGNYYSLPITIQNIDYTVLLDKNELLDQYIDTSNLNFTPLNLYKVTMCCEIKGYAFRFHKDEKGKYQLRELEHYYDYNDDFILKADKKYFPIQYEEIPEPESSN